MEKQVESLTHSLRECTLQSEKDRQAFEQITSQHVRELKAMQEILPTAQADLATARKRMESLEHGNKLLLRLVASLQPQCEFQVHELEARMSNIRDLEKTMGAMDAAFRDMVLEAEAGMQQTKAQVVQLESEVQRLGELFAEASARADVLEAALDKANRLNEEFVQHFNSVMSRQPDEVVSGMTLEQKMLFFRALLRSPDNLIMQLNEQDLLSHTVLSLRYAVCLFLREIRSKSINYESWMDTISEALGCEPEDLLNALLGHVKDAGRFARLGAMDRYSPVWTFLKREMEQCNVEIDLDSFERLKEGDEQLFLKIVSNEIDNSISSDEQSPTSERKAAVVKMPVSSSVDSAGGQSMQLSSDFSNDHVHGPSNEYTEGSRIIRSAQKHGHRPLRPGSNRKENIAVRREEDYIVKKYGLFDMTQLRGVKSFSIEDTIAMIGAVIDFKAESDYHCDLNIRPRLNMVKVVRLYIKQRCNKREASEAELQSLCRTVSNLHSRVAIVKIFGIISGMIDTSHWTERSACFFIEMLRGIKSLDDPGAESEDPDTLEEGWCLFRSWLNDPERVVKKGIFMKGLEAACSGIFGFGPMLNLSQKLERVHVNDPSKSTASSNLESTDAQEEDVDIYLHSALEVVCIHPFDSSSPFSINIASGNKILPFNGKLNCIFRQVIEIWLSQLDESREKLKDMFVQYDVNGDQELQMDEFIQLIKSTGYKMRQHDAMNMFHELAGPDDTVDQDEFSELVVFMKFNIRAILGK